jgi:tetratricopeptide (TPR) repeat protein
LNETQPDRRGTWTAALVAAGAALVVYLAARQVTSYDFVNYDDVYVVAKENPAIGKGLVGGAVDLADPVRHPQFMSAWLPLYYWSLGLDHAVGGGAAWVFHLHSVLLHALGAAMVALIARRLGAGAFVAGLAGVVFAVHPVATENVAWIASRKDVLSFVWMAAAALCYLDGIEKRRPALHALGALCLFVSLLAKGTTLVLPLLLVVHAFLVRDDLETPRRRLAPVLPYAAVAVAMTTLHLWVAHREGTAGAGGAAGLGALLAVDLQAVWRYFAALTVPLVQSVEHGITAGDADTRQAVLGAAVLVAGAVVVATAWKRRPVAAAVLCAVPLALLPFNNVLPRTSVLFAERYAYVALLPAAIGIAWLLRPRGEGAARYLPAAVGVGLLAALTAHRLPVWRDSIALWTDAAEKAPQSALVQCQLADAYGSAARAATGDEAQSLAARADDAWRSAKTLATTDLDRVRAESGLATHLLVTAGTSKDAAAQLKEAVANLESASRTAASLDAPGVVAQRVQILTNLATCRELLGDIGNAVPAWTEAVRLDENCAQGWNGLARVYVAASRKEQLADALARSEKAAPHDPAIVRERAKIRIAAGDAAGAKRELADAIAANPEDVDLLVDAARLDAMWMRPVDAEQKLRKALEIRTGDESLRELLAAALLDQAQSQAARDDMPAARDAARKAGEIEPKSSAPEQMLGIVARRAGNLEEAAEHLRRARDLHPEGPRIREQLASVLVELAVRTLDDKREGLALMLLEEAVQAHASAIATPKFRLDTGVADWPEPEKGDDRSAVARGAALKGLAYLGVGRAADALPELVVAEAGTRGGDPRLRRVVLRLLVRARLVTGHADDAVAAARELASLDVPGDSEWAWKRHAELADALIERGTGRRTAKDQAGADADFAAARASLEAAKAAQMPEARLRSRLGEILFREQDFLAATKEFDAAEKAAPDDVEPVLDRAQVWHTQYLLEEDRAYLVQAERDFKRAAEIAPGDPRVLAGLGETLATEQKFGEAFPWLQKAVLADPSQAMARKLLADLAIRAGRSHLEKTAGAPAAQVQQELVEARSAADRAVALDPPAPEALLFLGEVLQRQGDWVAPLAKFETARDRFPDSTAPLDAIAKFHMDRGHVELLLKKRAEAIADFRKALDVPRTTVDLSPAKERLHEIAMAAGREAMDLDKEGKLAEAIDRFAVSISAEPTVEGHFARGVLLGRAERFDEAVAEYDAAIAMDPKMSSARLNRAAALLRLGRLDDALAAYRAWLEIAPPDDKDRRAVQRQIDWILAQKKELDREPPK